MKAAGREMEKEQKKGKITTDPRTIEGFGEEWAAFDQSRFGDREREREFARYFSVFPFDELGGAEGFDLGCGSGRWAALAARRVAHLHCIDPAEKALAVARANLAGQPNVSFHLASSDNIPLADGSQDFGYSLGVLHHTPDTEAALAKCVAKLKPGAPFLVYLYYIFDNQPGWFRQLWRISDLGRRVISRLPFGPRRVAAEALAAAVYWPLSQTARLGEKLGANVRSFPLSHYRDKSFYTMRTDALDRFGTRLEWRFSRGEIDAMMRRCGLEDIVFREGEPFWCACGRKARA
jgi:SAM-dependent methyltransferase